MADTTQDRQGFGLVDRFRRTWRDPRGAVRLELETASESRLLFYAFASSVLFTLAALAAKTLNPTPAIARDYQTWVVTQAVVGTFFRPLALYGVAAVIGLLCRSAGGHGSYQATRTAVFWTGLVAAPAGVALTALGAAATGLFGAPAEVGLLGETLGSVVWAALLAPGLAVAHGFASTRMIWAAFGLVIVVAWMLAGLT